ncbi:MAG: transcriptional regulator NrdR [Candidatus Wallbacteria bacterium]|nr:transcriptional regulator NrdR [Candidatus Wallbacteria bacterium]
MKCPYCKSDDTRVIETREIDNNYEIRRRRECPTCSRRFTTREKLEGVVKMVVKNDGRREEFSSQKLRHGLQRACEKRPISAEAIESIVSGVEQEVFLLPQKEVDSRFLGKMVMEALKRLDDVAYIRFASVYKQFKDVTEFAVEIENIKKGRGKERSRQV